jgi:transposase
VRQEKSVPLLESLISWLEKQRDDVLPKSPMGEAITYAVNHWSALNIYMHNENLAIDNNRAKRAVKPFTVGRKN